MQTVTPNHEGTGLPMVTDAWEVLGGNLLCSSVKAGGWHIPAKGGGEEQGERGPGSDFSPPCPFVCSRSPKGKAQPQGSALGWLDAAQAHCLPQHRLPHCFLLCLQHGRALGALPGLQQHVAWWAWA